MEIKGEREVTCATYLTLTWQPSWPSTVAEAQPTRAKRSPSTSASRQRRVDASAPEASTSSLPACLAPPRCTRRRHAAPGPLSLSPVPLPSLLSLPLAPERAHRRRSLLPWPQPLPRLAVAPRGSASTPSSSPPSHEVPDALQRRHHRRFRRRPPKIAAVDSPPPTPPRAHFDCRCNRGELRHRFPLPV